MTGEAAGAGVPSGGSSGGTAADRARPLTVVIADDQALVRSGFRLILKAAGVNVVAEAADGEQAVAAVLEHQPDVVLLDIRMPRLDGIEATRRIVARWPCPPPPAVGGAFPSPDPEPADGRPRIIILTTFDLDEYVYAALAAGASGFLLKDVTPEHLVAAIQLVRTGDALLAPSITRRLVERFAGSPGQPRPGGPGTPDGAAGPGTARRPDTRGRDISALTPRELQVLGLVARGMSNAEIAASLFLSEATVKTHVARILAKLGLRDRVQAVVLAYESGLVSPGT
ncbi:MAG TPA: response regulator transcription factor [Trebonia sp.]|jgi:DNA-binding NarL/FixJ family response regulator|nr:response regulator transcription factor [Trebonia sp.]